MITTLRFLVSGRRFKVLGTGSTGHLVKVNECRAVVKFDDGQDGSISPGTEVEPLEMQHVEVAKQQIEAVKIAPIVNPDKKCWCGCGEDTSGSKFKPGHDARFHGRIKRLKRGTLTMETLKTEIGQSNYAFNFYQEAIESH